MKKSSSSRTVELFENAEHIFCMLFSNQKRSSTFFYVCAAARTTAFTQNETKSSSLCSILRPRNCGIKLTYKAAITVLNNLRKN